MEPTTPHKQDNSVQVGIYKNLDNDDYIPNSDLNPLDPWTQQYGVPLMEPEHPKKQRVYNTLGTGTRTTHQLGTGCPTYLEPVHPPVSNGIGNMEPIEPRRSGRIRNRFQPYVAEPRQAVIIMPRAPKRRASNSFSSSASGSSEEMRAVERSIPGPIAGKKWVTEKMVRDNPELAGKNRHHRESEAYRAATRLLTAIRNKEIIVDPTTLAKIKEIFDPFLENFAKRNEDISKM